MAQKGKSHENILMAEVNALMIIRMKYKEQRGRGVTIPRVRYVPKGGIPYKLLND